MCALGVLVCSRNKALAHLCLSLLHVDGAAVPHGDGTGSFLEGCSRAILAVAPSDVTWADPPCQVPPGRWHDVFVGFQVSNVFLPKTWLL